MKNNINQLSKKEIDAVDGGLGLAGTIVGTALFTQILANKSNGVLLLKSFIYRSAASIALFYACQYVGDLIVHDAKTLALGMAPNMSNKNYMY